MTVVVGKPTVVAAKDAPKVIPSAATPASVIWISMIAPLTDVPVTVTDVIGWAKPVIE